MDPHPDRGNLGCAAGPVPSPCTLQCELDSRSQICRGCLRTLEEIVAWTCSTDSERRAVLRRIQERRSALAPG